MIHKPINFYWKIFFILCSLGSFLIFSLALADGVPTILSFQGRLTDSSSNLLGGSGTTYYFKFSIWDSSTIGSGTRLWPSSVPATTTATIRQGVFNVNIGDTANGYPDSLIYNFSTNKDIYLQIEVSSDNNSSQTLSPRQRIAASAFSQLSGAVRGTSTPSAFGTTTPISERVVTIEATSTRSILLTLRALASQVANLFEIQNSSGSNLLSVTAGGGLFASSTLQVTDSSIFYGTLGVGTTSPSALFGVQGNALISGTTTVGRLIATSTIEIRGSGTSTFSGGLQANILNITSSSATSTFANGIVLSAGCFQLPDGTCAGAGAASLFTDGGATTYLTSTDNFGLGTTSIAFLLGVHGNALLSGNLTLANLTATGTLTVSGLSTLTGLISTASSTFTQGLNITGPIEASSTLRVSGLASLAGGLISNASTSISGTLSVTNPITASSTLSVNGLTTLAGYISTASSSISNELHVSGRFRASSTVSLATTTILTTASGTVETQLTLVNNSGATSTGSRLNFGTLDAYNGATTTANIASVLTQAYGGATGILTVSTLRAGLLTEAVRLTDAGRLGIGTTTPVQLLSVQGNGLISGDLTLANLTATGTLTITGLTTFNGGLISTASSTFTQNLNITGPIESSSTLRVFGLASLAGGLISNASTSISGTLSVTNPVTASSTLLVSGLSTLTGFISTASSTITQGFNVTGAIEASSSLRVAGLSTLAGGLISNASTSISGTLSVTNPITASSTLLVNGLSTLSGFISTASSTFTQGFNVTGPIEASSTLRVGSILSVLGTASSSFTGPLGIGTTTPWGILSVEMSGTNPSFVISNNGSSTPTFFVGGTNQDGRVSIGTTSLRASLFIEAASNTVPFRIDAPLNYLDGWTYRAPITVTSSTSTLTNFPVDLTLDTATLVTAGKLQSDCDDLRVTGSDGITQLDYWLETGCNSASTVIWVEVPTVTANGNTSLYLYYGNASAAAGSNGDNTFTFFDDFPGSSIDTTKWIVDNSTGLSVSGGNLVMTSNVGKIRSNSWSYAGTQVIQETQGNVTTEFTTGASGNIGLTIGGFWNSTTDGITFLHHDSSADYYRNNSTWTSAGNVINASTEFLMRSSIISGTQVTLNLRNYSTDASLYSATVTNTVSSGERILLVGRADDSNGRTGNATIAWVRVRLYDSAEPTTGIAFTSEETFPAGHSVLYVQSGSGKVGIGTTSPSHQLTVQGSALVTGFLTVQGGGVSSFTGSSLGVASSSPWGTLSVEMNTTNPSFVVSNQGSSTPSLYIAGVNQNGYVGIGTSSPNRALTVIGNIDNLLHGSTTFPLLGSHTLNAGAASGKIAVQGRLLYAADTEGLKIFDISTSTPALVGRADPDSPTDVIVAGKFAYVFQDGQSSNNRMFIYDISNVSSPLLLSNTLFVNMPTTPTFFPLVSGNYVYLASSEASGMMEIWDVSNPAKPFRTGRVASFAGGGTVGASAFYGKYMYVSNRQVTVIDISDPYNPVVTCSGCGSFSPTGLSAMTASGNYLYVVGGGASNPMLRIADVSDPTNVRVLIGLQDMNTNNYEVPILHGRYLYIADTTNEAIVVVDVSNPTGPYTVARFASGGTDPSGMAVSGNQLYTLHTAGSDLLTVHEIPGLQVSAAQIGALEIGSLNALEDIVTRGSLRVFGGLNIGAQGMLSAGGITSLATTSANAFIGSVYIGTTSPATSSPNFTSFQTSTAVIEATSSASVPLTIRGAGTQAANYLQIQNATNTNLLVLDRYGRLGIGTSTPTRQLSLSELLYVGGAGTSTVENNFHVLGTLQVGNSSISIGNNFINSTATTTFNVPAINIGSNQLVIQQNSGRVAFGTSTPTYGFEVATRTVAFNSGKDGSLDAWKTANALPTTRLAPSLVTGAGYIYVVGGRDGAARDTVFYAKLNSDGSVGNWATSSFALPAARDGHSSVVSNGYIYVLGGLDSGGNRVSTVYYAKINRDGSPGPWKTNHYNLPAAWNSAAAVSVNGYIYFIGGDSGVAVNSNVYYSRLNSDGSTGPWTTVSGPDGLKELSAVVANGYLYVVGGSGLSTSINKVYFATTSDDGSLSPWRTNPTNLPNVAKRHSAAVMNGHLYVISGMTDPNTLIDDIVYGRINSNGTIDTWINAYDLPAARSQGAAAVANGYIYFVGGSDGSNQDEVYYTSGPRVILSGALDLLGFSSTTLADFSGDLGGQGEVGGSIYAGSIFAKGSLEVGGETQFWRGVSINNFLSIHATTSAAQNIAIFSIQNATTTQPLFTALYNGNIGIGTSSPEWLFQISGSTTKKAILTLSDPLAGTNLKHWTLSSQGGEFYIATSSDAYATSSIPAFMINSNGNVGIGTTSPGSRLSIQGNCSDTGGGDGCADYAELYPSSEPVESGDLVMLDPDNPKSVKKALSPQRNLLIGAVSTNPAIVIEGSSLQLLTGSNYHNNPNKPAIALAGKIPVKVNLEGGQIAVGDPITISSEPGVGRKTEESGKIIGYALEPYPKPTTDNQQLTTNNQILIFVNLGYWINSATSDVQNIESDNLGTSGVQSDSLLSQVVSLVKQWLESMQVFIENGVVRMKELVAERITGKKATFDQLELKDEDTGAIHCVKIKNSALLSVPGECGSTILTTPEDLANETLQRSSGSIDTLVESSSDTASTSP